MYMIKLKPTEPLKSMGYTRLSFIDNVRFIQIHIDAQKQCMHTVEIEFQFLGKIYDIIRSGTVEPIIQNLRQI